MRRLIDRVLGSTGVLDPAQRQSAYADGSLPAPLDRFVHKVHHHAYRVSDEDIAAPPRRPTPTRTKAGLSLPATCPFP